MNSSFLHLEYPNPVHLQYLQDFLDSAKSSLKTFRYFKTRSFSVLSNHVLTCLLMIDNEPVGYGHLDREGDCVWLGVCIREGDRHKGYGGKICLYLTEYADQIKIPTLFLTVDEENTTGRRLYESKGFKIVEKKGNRLFYARKI